jgi:hypothetical protein
VAVARVACGVSLWIELYDELDGPEARRAREAVNLAIAIGNAAMEGQPAQLNVETGGYVLEREASRKRPTAVLLDLAPLSFSMVYNSFRRADEFECVLPLSVLPVPPEAIRLITCEVLLRQVTAEEWEEGLRTRGNTAPRRGSYPPDFVGTCSSESISMGEGLPTIKLPFRDYLGLLASKKVPPGVTIDQSLKLSEAVGRLLVGTPAEGLAVKWVDSAEEPIVGAHIPKAQKKQGKNAKRPVASTQSYLDAIMEECTRLGCVARLKVTTLEISNAAPLYEGQLSTSKAAILVGQVVESIEAEHTFVGVKTQSVQVVSYNPDTSQTYTARWPPDPAGEKATVVEPGKPPRLPPVMANVGLPGYEQLDESVLLVAWAPSASKERLSEVAQMIFLERTRQRVTYRVKTHAPWSDPRYPDEEGGTLLRLRAGDTVDFGYLGEDDNALLPAEVRALTGQIGRDGLALLLQTSGVGKDTAQRLAQLLTSVPRLSKFRVDELHVSGSDKGDAELTFKLVNFVQIVEDFQQTEAPSDAYQKVVVRAAELAMASVEDVKKAFADAYRALENAANEAEEEGRQKLDALLRTVMKGRR